MSKTPFSWKVFEELSAESPDFDLMATFSFERLYGEELEQVIGLR